MESKLYERFMEGREKGQAIRREWFRRHSIEIFIALYPNMERSVFRLSTGWFEDFLSRYKISLTAVTKKAQKIPEDYKNIIFNWLRFNRENSQPLCI
ncbi:hypothetical protein L873DRAFT_420694 [Choiromyces venosus 120613-1]|uniref:HTH CENPB-type domain-containing protein n=1 Tax=Choiromyces venosus 120613-1 TaxID=1336337 RepID=A0A3N4K091_9PEZI|nr:hypothetical protein L873DRAFT_420694 [Choiromyces venosus 120613-1]